MTNIDKSKDVLEIAVEWDAICEKRELLIDNDKDFSLKYVTAPCILRNLAEDSPNRVIDVGCGTGFITNQISQNCDYCCGIDISAKSIELAKNKYRSKNLKFVNTTISDFNPNNKFDACVANMVFMTDPEWVSSIQQIYKVLNDNAYLLIMITHPCSWPHYWGYIDAPWFNYNKEIYIEHDFRTSLSETIGVTTHIHRPLSMYINGLIGGGFNIIKIEDPYPIEKIPDSYNYNYPRFLFIKCKKDISQQIKID